MNLYRQSFSQSTVDSTTAEVMAYGIFIMNGGRPSDFDEFTTEDVDILLNTYFGLMDMNNTSLSRMIIKGFVGGDSRWQTRRCRSQSSL